MAAKLVGKDLGTLRGTGRKSLGFLDSSYFCWVSEGVGNTHGHVAGIVGVVWVSSGVVRSTLMVDQGSLSACATQSRNSVE